jgi:hypothetical protein
MSNETLALEYERRGLKTIVTARLADQILHKDTCNLASAAARKRFAKELLAKAPALNGEEIDGQLLSIADAASGKSDPAPAGRTHSRDDAAELLADMPEDICAEAQASLADELLIQHVVDDVAALGVAGEKELAATVYLIGVSRLLDRPLAGIIQGPSSSGKSYLIEKAASLFPPETVIHATQMTPQALFHMPPGSLSHRFIVGGERSRVEDDERAEATRALREMLSAGKLTKLMPMKVEGGRIETVRIEQEGPVAYIESTTLARIFDEDANRCLLLHTDERPEQTRRIVRQLAASYTRGNGSGATERITLRHHALQRMLEPLPVAVPYAQQLGELIPSDRVEVRRAFPHLIGMVQAVTLLHQRQRVRNADGVLVATEGDYQIARHLLLNAMARLLGNGLSDPARRFHERLRAWGAEQFTTTEAKRREKSSKSAVSGWLAELHDAGLVELIQPGRGRTPSTWRLADPAHPADAGNLPTVEDVFAESARTHGRKAELVIM